MKNTELNLLLEIVKDIRSDVTDVKKALYGNGKFGICDRISKLENTQQSILGKIGLIATFFGLVFTAIFEIVTKFFTKKIGME